MSPELTSWLALCVASPVLVTCLCWVGVIYHACASHWRATDLLVAALVVEEALRQAGCFVYSLLLLLQPASGKAVFCASISWFLVSCHALQALTLATLLAVAALAARRRPSKSPPRAWFVYHLCLMAAVSALIGLAAVLARHERSSTASKFEMDAYCKVLPHEIDSSFAFYWLTIHAIVNIGDLIALIAVLVLACRLKHGKQSMQVSRPTSILKADTSASEISDSALSKAESPQPLALSTSPRTVNASGSRESLMYDKYPWMYATTSTSSGSSDSRAPCLRQASSAGVNSRTSSTPSQQPALLTHQAQLRLSTVVALYILLLLCSNLPPLICTVAGLYGSSGNENWSDSSGWAWRDGSGEWRPTDTQLVLWAGLLQGVLLPIVLTLCDAHFVPWVRRVYARRPAPAVPPPHGAEGKFTACSSPLHSLNSVLASSLDRPKVPLTNGSLKARAQLYHALGYNSQSNISLRMSLPENMYNLSSTFTTESADSSLEPTNSKQVNNLNHPKPNRYFCQDSSIGITAPSSAGQPKLMKDEFRIDNTVNVQNFQLYEDEEDPVYASLGSACSATTLANEDFEFFNENLQKRPIRNSGSKSAPPQSLLSNTGNSTASGTCSTRVNSDFGISFGESLKELQIKKVEKDIERELIRPSNSSSLSIFMKDFNEDLHENINKSSIITNSNFILKSDGKLLENNFQNNSRNYSSLSVESVRSSYLTTTDDEADPFANKERGALRKSTPPPINLSKNTKKSSTPTPKARRSRHCHHNHHHHHQQHYHKNAGKKRGGWADHLATNEFYNRYTNRMKKPTVLSVDSLTTALTESRASYLDTGEICRHENLTTSMPDFGKVFISEFI